jgi:hypothetical protein
MTKEMDLFKRWFGWDPRKGLFNDELKSTYDFESMEIDAETDKTYQIVNYRITILFELISPKDREFNLYDLPKIKHFNYNNEGSVYFALILPFKYHAEWEQYVKDTKE